MRQRIVIIGGGFAGVECAKRLSERFKQQQGLEVVLLSADSYLLFYPLLIKVAVGSLEARHVSVNLRTYLPACRVILGKFLGFSPVRRSVKYRALGKDQELSLDYDQLILALGGASKIPDIPGLRAKALTISDLNDSSHCYHAVMRRFEDANALEPEQVERRRALLSFAVVGGGYTGVEMASELMSLLQHASKNYPKIKPEDCAVHLIEMQDHLMGGVSAKLDQVVTERLKSQGVQLHLACSLKEVGEGVLSLDSGRKLRLETVFWAGGLSPNPVILNLPVPKSKGGLIQTTEYLNVAGLHDVWAIGDCANNPDRKGEPLPNTAQIAKKLAKHLVKNLVNLIESRPLLAHRVKSQGMLLPMAERFAVLYTKNLVIKGRAPWLLWFVYHIVMLPQARHKTLVMAELILNQIVGRELVDPALRSNKGQDLRRIA